MVEISNFILCGNARTDSNGVITAQNIINFFSLTFLPTQLSFDVVFTVSKYEPGVHNIKFIIRNKKSGETLIETKDPSVNLIENSKKLPELNCINCVLNIRNLVFNEEGLYTCQIYFDDNPLVEKDIYVSKN